MGIGKIFAIVGGVLVGAVGAYNFSSTGCVLGTCSDEAEPAEVTLAAGAETDECGLCASDPSSKCEDETACADEGAEVSACGGEATECASDAAGCAEKASCDPSECDPAECDLSECDPAACAGNAEECTEEKAEECTEEKAAGCCPEQAKKEAEDD